jgi:hypothetical protein
MEGVAASDDRDQVDVKIEEFARQHGEVYDFTLPVGNVRCLFRAPYLSEWERLQNRLVEAKDRMVLFRELAGQLLLYPTKQEFNNALERNFAFPPKLAKFFEDNMGGVAEGAAKKG